MLCNIFFFHSFKNVKPTMHSFVTFENVTRIAFQFITFAYCNFPPVINHVHIIRFTNGKPLWAAIRFYALCPFFRLMLCTGVCVGLTDSWFNRSHFTFIIISVKKCFAVTLKCLCRIVPIKIDWMENCQPQPTAVATTIQYIRILYTTKSKWNFQQHAIR